MLGAAEDVPGFTVPVHRALCEPILLGGAPRAIAIMNGTLAGALGLGLRLWLAGIVIWAIGHVAAVWDRESQVGRLYVNGELAYRAVVGKMRTSQTTITATK